MANSTDVDALNSRLCNWTIKIALFSPVIDAANHCGPSDAACSDLVLRCISHTELQLEDTFFYCEPILDPQIF